MTVLSLLLFFFCFYFCNGHITILPPQIGAAVLGCLLCEAAFSSSSLRCISCIFRSAAFILACIALVIPGLEKSTFLGDGGLGTRFGGQTVDAERCWGLEPVGQGGAGCCVAAFLQPDTTAVALCSRINWVFVIPGLIAMLSILLLQYVIVVYIWIDRVAKVNGPPLSSFENFNFFHFFYNFLFIYLIFICCFFAYHL